MKIKQLLFVSLLAVLMLGLLGCGKEEAPDVTETATAKVNKISAETAMEMMASEDPFTLVDVRTQAEFDEGHIEGAMLLPSDELETLAPDKLTDKDAVILVYCRSGNRSAAASQLLIDLGYTQVYDMGGIIDWPGEVVI